MEVGDSFSGWSFGEQRYLTIILSLRFCYILSKSELFAGFKFEYFADCHIYSKI